MSEHLSAAEHEALCICAEVGNDERTETETIALCNAHRCEVDHVMAAHAARAWDEGRDAEHSIECRWDGAPDDCICPNPYRNRSDR